jgi:hypothetical protein
VRSKQRRNAMSHHDATDTDLNNDENEDDDDDASATLREKLFDTLTPGYQAEFGPDEADMAARLSRTRSANRMRPRAA